MSEITKDNIGPLPDLKRKKTRRKRVVTPEELEKRRKPENLARLKKVGFQPGQSGNPAGRPATPKETKAFLEGKSLDVAQLLYDMAFDETIAPRERMKAAIWVAEQTIAKAPIQQEIKVNHIHDIGEMLLEAQRLAGKSQMIDITPKPLAIDDVTDV